MSGCVCVGLRFSLHFSFAGVVAFLSRKRKSNICTALADWFPPMAGPMYYDSSPRPRSLTTPEPGQRPRLRQRHSEQSRENTHTFCFSRRTTHPFYFPFPFVIEAAQPPPTSLPAIVRGGEEGVGSPSGKVIKSFIGDMRIRSCQKSHREYGIV